MGSLFAAAAAAAAPMVADTVLPSELEKKDGSKQVERDNRIAKSLAQYLLCVGFDALAGVTFARVARNLGRLTKYG